jgi:hypothetical protein
MGSSTSFSAAWTTRSAITGIPSRRTLPDPPGLGSVSPAPAMVESGRSSDRPVDYPRNSGPPQFLNISDRQAIDAGSAGAPVPRDPAERRHSVAGSHTKLNRSFETAARIGHPPNDEVWPASPIPSATHPPGPPVVGRSAPTGGYWPPPAPIRRCGYGSLTSQPGSPPAAT